MPAKQLFLDIEGPDAKELADAICKEINAEFDLQIQPRTIQPAPSAPPEGKKMDPATVGIIVGVTGAVLAIPGAILAGLQLKERLDKKKRFEEVASKGKLKMQGLRITAVRFRINNREFEFEETTFAEICDEANRED